MNAPVRFSTAGLPETDRIARWEEHNAKALIGLRCRSLHDTALDATEINLQLPTAHLARVVGSPHVVERAKSEIRRVPSDAVACYLTLAGEAFFYHDDGVRLLHPGQLLVCDADQPFMRGFSHGLEELAVKIKGDARTELDLPRARTLIPQGDPVEQGGDWHAQRADVRASTHARDQSSSAAAFSSANRTRFSRSRAPAVCHRPGGASRFVSSRTQFQG